MASLASASLTPLCHLGVFRVLTQEFLQHRKSAIKNYHSMSDSEEVRWVRKLSFLYKDFGTVKGWSLPHQGQ